MASTSSSSSTLSISTALVDGKAPCRQSAAPYSPSPQYCVISLPSIPPPPSKTTTAFCRKISRNVISMASSTTTTTTTVSAETSVTSEQPELVKTIQEAWDNVEDKYAVSALAAAATVALWGSAGVISAIDRLPLVPGLLEVLGIGYTGWFAYKNLVFKPDREAFVHKVKDTFKQIIG